MISVSQKEDKQLEFDFNDRALCIFNGMLIIAQFTRSSGKGKCLSCGSSEDFYDDGSWIRCYNDCDFAILKSDYDKMMQE